MGIGERIKEARKSIRMTQAELAEKINISISTLRRYESGSRTMKTNEIEELAAALNASADYLWGKNDILPEAIHPSKHPSRQGIPEMAHEGFINNKIVIEMGTGANKTRYILPATPESYAFLERQFAKNLRSTSKGEVL